MGFLVCFISCQRDDTFQDTKAESQLDLKSVNTKDVVKTYKFSQSTKNAQNWITPYFDYNDSIRINNSSAYIKVTPAVTDIPNAYTRLFSLNIDGEIKTVVYNMFPNDRSSRLAFYGSVIITELNGDILSAFEIENNLFTKYYHVKGSGVDVSILEMISKNGDGCVDENQEDLWVLCGEEVIVEGDPPEDSASIIIIFVPVLVEAGDGGGGGIPPPTPTEPSATATDTNEDTCPPGMVKDDNGECVEPLEECPDGYDRNDDGDCVKDPCPEIVNQLSDSDYKAKLDELNTNLNTWHTDEKGYGLTTTGNAYSLPTSNNGHSINYSGINLNTVVGFVHTHPCGENDVGSGQNTTIVSSAPMPSPRDIRTFISLLFAADDNNRNIHDVYMTVINCHGIYDLKYTGVIGDLHNWNMSKELFKSYFEEYENNNELAFKKYLDEVVQISGLELYKYIPDDITDGYELENLDLNQNGDDVESQNDCN